mmetsp:Transcript_69384/g.166365  ORF Transcript_69384/g.166365 Transcript_69384/m.166365 type:complete len:266 (+) Transcript_69384:116-913(+)
MASSSEDKHQEEEKGSGKGMALRLFFGACVIGLSGILYVKFHHLLSISELRRNHSAMVAWVDDHPQLAPAAYIGTLILVIGITCPGATMLSFVGGIFFKQPYASVYAYCGYIVGATVSFFLNSFVIGDFMRRRLANKSGLYKKFEANAKRNAFVYLVVARYTMVFPFFFVNAAAALVGVRWKTFVAATSVSCIPGSVIYTTAGGALANLLHKMADTEKLDKSELMWMAVQDKNVQVCLAGVSIALCILGTVQFLQKGKDGADKDE